MIEREVVREHNYLPSLRQCNQGLYSTLPNAVIERRHRIIKNSNRRLIHGPEVRQAIRQGYCCTLTLTEHGRRLGCYLCAVEFYGVQNLSLPRFLLNGDARTIQPQTLHVLSNALSECTSYVGSVQGLGFERDSLCSDRIGGRL